MHPMLPEFDFQVRATQGDNGELDQLFSCHQEFPLSWKAQAKVTKEELNGIDPLKASPSRSTEACKTHAVPDTVRISHASYVVPNEANAAPADQEVMTEFKERTENYREILKFMEYFHNDILLEHGEKVQTFQDQLLIEEQEVAAYQKQVQTLKAKVAELALDLESATRAVELSSLEFIPQCDGNRKLILTSLQKVSSENPIRVIPWVAHAPQRSKAALEREAKDNADYGPVPSDENTIDYISNLFARPKVKRTFEVSILTPRKF